MQRSDYDTCRQDHRGLQQISNALAPREGGELLLPRRKLQMSYCSANISAMHVPLTSTFVDLGGLGTLVS